MLWLCSSPKQHKPYPSTSKSTSSINHQELQLEVVVVVLGFYFVCVHCFHSLNFLLGFRGVHFAWTGCLILIELPFVNPPHQETRRYGY